MSTPTPTLVLALNTFSVQRSASLEELVAALQIHDDGSLKMMFENDEKVSFSFGPDEADEINFGKMKVIDVYDERYLVGHSVWHGEFLLMTVCCCDNKCELIL